MDKTTNCIIIDGTVYDYVPYTGGESICTKCALGAKCKEFKNVTLCGVLFNKPAHTFVKRVKQ